MTLKEATKTLKHTLTSYYDQREASNITALVMEKISGKNRVDRLIGEMQTLTTAQTQLLEKFREELTADRPVQYVLGSAHFAGLDLYVDEHVLIPRPETEELVQWVEREVRSLTAKQKAAVALLDIGTGSGCIALSIKNRLPALRVTAIDVDPGALAVATRNAAALDLEIAFLQLDILRTNSWPVKQCLDVIVSNPPYIGQPEKADMLNHVLAYEPHQALFVSGTDLLIFYRKIADFALLNLNPGGQLFFEINEQYGPDIQEMLKEKGFEAIEVRRDLQGKDRMVKCLLKK